MFCGLRHTLFFLTAFLGVALLGCSVQLTRGDLPEGSDTREAQEQQPPLFQNIPLILGTDTLWLEQDLLTAYNRAAPAAAYPRESCQGSAQILASIRQNGKTSAWSIPLVIIPFWPVQPVDETWTYKLEVQIHCGDVVIKQAEFTEEETMQALWYGKLRSDLLNQASQEMHRKLTHRLAFELDYRYNADLNSASDY